MADLPPPTTTTRPGVAVFFASARRLGSCARNCDECKTGPLNAATAAVLGLSAAGIRGSLQPYKITCVSEHSTPYISSGRAYPSAQNELVVLQNLHRLRLPICASDRPPPPRLTAPDSSYLSFVSHSVPEEAVREGFHVPVHRFARETRACLCGVWGRGHRHAREAVFAMYAADMSVPIERRKAKAYE